ILYACDVARIGPGEVGVRALGVRELLERACVDELLAERVVLLRGAVTPADRVGLRELGELLHPGDKLAVLRGNGRFNRHGATRPFFGVSFVSGGLPVQNKPRAWTDGQRR